MPMPLGVAIQKLLEKYQENFSIKDMNDGEEIKGVFRNGILTVSLVNGQITVSHSLGYYDFKDEELDETMQI